MIAFTIAVKDGQRTRADNEAEEQGTVKTRRAKMLDRSSIPTDPKVETIPFKDSAQLVTLIDPHQGPEAARGAFARLRPPPDHPPTETAVWRQAVAAVALAVRVMPAERSALVAADDARPDDAPVRTFREEVMVLAAEHTDPELETMLVQILDGVGL